MKQNPLFRRSRYQLAIWYAGIISIILIICTLGFYEAIAHAHRITIEQELTSVGGTLHDSLLPILKQPGKLELEVSNLLPNACLVRSNCNEKDPLQPYRLGTIQQDKYYLRLFDLSSQLVAIAGIKPQLPPQTNSQQWLTLTDNNGIRYRQISLLLHTQTGQQWGYLQIGKSLADFDRYIANIRWILLLGIPLIILLVVIASWWSAELAIRPIYQSYRQMQQFIADAAHELRTPLAAIQATLQANLMLPQLTENQARESLTKILRQNKRLSHLVADLLTLSRIDAELNHITPQNKRDKIFLSELITEVVEELAALAMASEIELIYQANNYCEIVGDRSQIYRLMINLVTNAIEYTPPGGRVILRVQADKGNVIVSVRDTGIGISQKEQKKIFERFYRVDKARSRSKGGAGLGLSMVKAIAVSHQGSVEVTSTIGQGSNFIIRLPIRSQ